MSESLCERCGRPSGGLRCAAAVCPPLVAMRRVPRCACGKEATRELTYTAEGEAEPYCRDLLCEDCAAWIIEGAPVRGHA